MLIDSHAHLDDERYRNDLDEVLDRARLAGVAAVITMGTSLESSRAAVAIAQRYPMVRAAVGVHPHEAQGAGPETWRQLEQLAADPSVVAIGEIGLDFHYNYSPPDIQLEVFRRQVALAGELGLPIVVHNREAHQETEAVLMEIPPARRGVVHCYSGDAAMGLRLVEGGYYLSFAGPVTFGTAAGKHYQEVLSSIPLGSFMVETDCPYLSPAPFRGQRNEPARVRLVADKVAALLNRNIDEIIEYTFQATANLFSLNVVGI